jgi:putative spermidine/putrescine transport system substrate-binding protein
MKKLNVALLAVLIITLLTLTACSNKKSEDNVVTFYGWGGDVRINEWIDTELSPFVMENYDIKVQRVPMNIDEILLKLTNEKSSDKEGTIDVIWINGENFHYAKKYDLLHGPFLSEIENAKAYIDLEGPAATVDFGYPTEGYEAPWGKAQFVFFNNGDLLPDAPKNTKELKTLLVNQPGIFTYPEATDFVGSAFIRTVIYDIVGYENVKDLPADYDTVKAAIEPAIDYLNELKPYLWKEGKVYPKDVAQLDGLYQDGIVYMAMDYNANKAMNKVMDESWSMATRTFVWDKGTPFNTHYLAIASNAPNKENAIKFINAALSAEMQTSKADLSGWADLPVLEYSKLSETQQSQLDKVLSPDEDYKETILTYDALNSHKQPEVRADLVTIIEEVWQNEVLFNEQ